MSRPRKPIQEPDSNRDEMEDPREVVRRSVMCPLLVIVGEQDEPFVIASRLMADAIPGAELVTIPNAGHSPQFENPEAWIAALTGFLSALPTAAR